MNSKPWHQNALAFIHSLEKEPHGAYGSVPGGPETLYGTCYGLLARYYLGDSLEIAGTTKQFIRSGQDAVTGLFCGPELAGFEAPANERHDREHLMMHLTCAVLPVCQQFGIPPIYPLHEARRFCDLDYLAGWLAARDPGRPWLEGNNLLFAGQLLVYLRDVEKDPQAPAALEYWFQWLDRVADRTTSLWWSDPPTQLAQAVYGGYHPLLVYYHEDRPILNPRGLVDVVLGLQHPDGGFNPRGNAGACEDVDCIDILVNMYKRHEYRRPDIRLAVCRCVEHILATQNPDGGFPYNRDRPQTHMGIPGTSAAANVSCMFPTWFRIHTLALAHEILPGHGVLKAIPFRFNRELSMGWHTSPAGWIYRVPLRQRREEIALKCRWRVNAGKTALRNGLWEASQRWIPARTRRMAKRGLGLFQRGGGIFTKLPDKKETR